MAVKRHARGKIAVISNQQNIWSRVLRMSWGEWRTRGRQELAKRRDATFYRLGKRFEGDAPRAGGIAPAHFFFEPADRKELVELYRRRFPDEAKSLLARAERICRHRFDLLGYEDLDCGEEIDWRFDAINQKQSPHKPWHKIRLLDFEEVGDVKVTWELNRHQHFITLAVAECLTQDGKFAAELMRHWNSWRAANPYPIGINWASSLEVAFRSMSWLWARALLADSPHVPGEFRAKMLRALALGGRHIETYLSTYSSPNTHLLGEAVGLFFVGTLCPELPSSARWRQTGWKIILEHAQKNVCEDGFYFEQSTYYHVYALDFFLHARILAAANGVAVPPEFDRTIEKMLELLSVLGRAGAPPRWGDDDGGRVFDARRNRAEHLLDPLSTGAALFGRGDFKSVAGGLRAETLWLLGRRGVEKFDGIAAQEASAKSIRFEASGIYVMAGAETPRQQMVIDGGPLGGGTGGHGHADTLSLHLTVDGRECLANPGTYVYMAAEGERETFRNSAAHNVLLVDSKSHAEPGGPFSWRLRPDASVEQWVTGERFDLFVGSHDGYTRLPQPATHRRWVFYLRDQFWLVRDVVQGSGAHDLEINWHLPPSLQPALSQKGALRAEVNLRAAVTILALNGHDWQQTLESAWWSPAYGKKLPSPVLRFRRHAQLPAEFATMICVTGAFDEEPETLLRMDGKVEGYVSGYEQATALGNHMMFFSDSEGSWTLGPWKSDARMLYCLRAPDGTLQQFALVQGSFVELDGNKILIAERSIPRCDAWREEDGWKIFAPSGESVRLTEPTEKAT